MRGGTSDGREGRERACGGLPTEAGVCGATCTVVVDCCGFSSNGEWRVVNNTSAYTSLSRQHADARPNGQTARYVSGCFESPAAYRQSTVCKLGGASVWSVNLVCRCCRAHMASYHEVHHVARVLGVQGPLRRRQLVLELPQRRHLGPPVVAVEDLPPFRIRWKPPCGGVEETKRER